MDEEAFVETLELVRRPANTLRGKAGNSGANSAHLFDAITKKLSGLVTSREVTASQITGVLVVVAAAGAGILWVSQFGYKKFQENKLAKSQELRNTLVPTVLPSIEIDNIYDFRTSEVESVEHTKSIELTTDQYMRLVQALLNVDAVKMAIIGILGNAEIVGTDEKALEWKHVLETGTPEEIDAKLKEELAANPEIMETPEIRELFLKFLGEDPDDGPEALGAPTR